MFIRLFMALLLCGPLFVHAQEETESQDSVQAVVPLDQEEDLRGRILEYQLLLRETLAEYGQLVRDYEFEYQETSLERRLRQERELASNPFSFTPHRRNYILPVSYSSNPNQERFEYIQQDTDLQPVEIKFQLSVKVPVMQGLLDDRGSVHFAYTQTSWWQAYNNDASKPFRETNYTPEVFFTYEQPRYFLGITNTWNRFGYAHQSNGRTEPQSRSWNYLYISSAFARGPWMLEATPRIKLPRFKGEDDNPDLEDYVGYLDLRLAYVNARQEYVLTVKGNPRTEKAGLQFDWSFPVYGRLRGLFQAYAGYGESLIDYDHENYRVSLGFQFTNQLFGEL